MERKITAKDIAEAIPKGHVWLFECTFTPEQQRYFCSRIADAVNKKVEANDYERAFIDTDPDNFPSC